MGFIQNIVKVLKRRYYITQMDICAKKMRKNSDGERVWIVWFLRYNDHLARLRELEK